MFLSDKTPHHNDPFFFGVVVGLVVSVRGGVVERAGLGVLAGGLGVQGGSGLTVESLKGMGKERYFIHISPLLF